MNKVIFFFLLVATVIARAEIIEIQNFKDIYSHITPETVIVLDIDDTLLIPVQMLGCGEWFDSRMRYYKGQGLSADECLDKSLAEWEGVRHLTKMEIVEPGTDKIIKELQTRGHTVMGLTTQGLGLTDRTKQQLLENQIDLKASAPTAEEHHISLNGHGMLFRAGIFYTGGAHKGKALFALLDKLKLVAKRVLFVNDKRSHLLLVQESAQERGIEMIGLRYGYSDARKARFDQKIADYQFAHSSFARILSDQEAQERMGNAICEK